MQRDMGGMKYKKTVQLKCRTKPERRRGRYKSEGQPAITTSPAIRARSALFLPFPPADSATLITTLLPTACCIGGFDAPRKSRNYCALGRCAPPDSVPEPCLQSRPEQIGRRCCGSIDSGGRWDKPSSVRISRNARSGRLRLYHNPQHHARQSTSYLVVSAMRP